MLLAGSASILAFYNFVVYVIHPSIGGSYSAVHFVFVEKGRLAVLVS